MKKEEGVEKCVIVRHWTIGETGKPGAEGRQKEKKKKSVFDSYEHKTSISLSAGLALFLFYFERERKESLDSRLDLFSSFVIENKRSTWTPFFLLIRSFAFFLFIFLFCLVKTTK